MRLSQLSKIAAAAAVLVLTATACGEQAQLGDTGTAPPVQEDVTFEAGTTMAELNEAGTLRVGTKFDQPLFGLRGLDGDPVGFDVEIAKIIAAKLGIPEDGVTYTETPSRIREDVIANDQVDIVVATYTINDTRRERVSFAGPYYQAGQDLMVAADNTTITGRTRCARPTPASARSPGPPRPRTSSSTSTRPTSCCSTCTPTAPTPCATARSTPSPPTTSSCSA
jgi:glutamate transport system substrate-binding protein